MSAGLHGFDGYYPHSHFRQPISAGPLATYDYYEDDDFSSDFDVVERDIDAEIEARLRLERLSPPPPPAPRTVSQQMLQSLQKHRAQSRAAASLPPRRRTSRAAERTLGDSMFDLRSEDASVASTERLTDTFGTPLSSRSGGSSCTDRLEARISKSFLTRRDSGSGLAAVKEGQAASVLYSGRRTYPAESLRKTEHARQSENTRNTAATPQETKMMEILDKERATRVFRPQMSCPEVSAHTKKAHGVRFHFRRGSSVDNDVLNGRMGRLALTDGRADAGVEQTALVRAQPPKRVTDPEYTVLASQLAEIEALVDGIERCMKTPSFSTLAVQVLKEMELLTKTTQQLRTNGTTLILANVGMQQNADFTQALRRLVARTASAQMRIGALVHAVKQL
ncbi:hypothetical protein PHYPSEUDO_008769 [Phytophthora pseudosyringae]|uniref:Uncharacterized protein n=1 Tax=Phytophthora pseudosyringae TaxID=221518 RepID=A0A8T1VGL3_9STRA|nr:hypothetical protein PHYPSEUDO_008769 [Phytophthora pseudosyringae]